LKELEKIESLSLSFYPKGEEIMKKDEIQTPSKSEGSG
jgi:hypothetical protein